MTQQADRHKAVRLIFAIIWMTDSRVGNGTSSAGRNLKKNRSQKKKRKRKTLVRMVFMKRKYYLIDTENIGDKWISLIDSLKEEEVLVVFYTKNHSRSLEEQYLKQRYNKKIRWIECVVGNDALDHQLVGVLSYLVATHSDASYVICSNDRGYENVIDFWKNRKIEISCMGFLTDRKNHKKNCLEGKEDDHQEEVLNRKKEEPEEIPHQQLFLEIARAVPVSDMGVWYRMLISLFGEKTGKMYYEQMKKEETWKTELSGNLLPDVRERNIRLIRFLYRQNGLDEGNAEKAYKIISVHNRKNKKAIQADFVRHFGSKTKEQAQYYKVVRPVIDFLKEMERASV